MSCLWWLACGVVRCGVDSVVRSCELGKMSIMAYVLFPTYVWTVMGRDVVVVVVFVVAVAVAGESCTFPLAEVRL